MIFSLFTRTGGKRMVKTKDFPGAKTKMERLLPIVNEYDFKDASRAIYCICVFPLIRYF